MFSNYLIECLTNKFCFFLFIFYRFGFKDSFTPMGSIITWLVLITLILFVKIIHVTIVLKKKKTNQK